MFHHHADASPVWMTFFTLQTGWCDSQGTVDDVRSKLYMRREGAIKRERAIAYALSHQVHPAGIIWAYTR
jgi:hypothetical protein